MKIAGIIAEYNPFHNGHAYHIEQTRQITGCDAVVCVMSTNFVQRGEVALFDKWSRAKMALLGGCDLVLELPTPYVLSSAEGFAVGALKVLGALNCINTLSFGSECDDISVLEKLAETALDEKVLALTKKHLKDGINFPSARQRAMANEGDLHRHIADPNNILAVEYLKAIKKLGLPLKPVAVKRHMAEHDAKEAVENFASASYIRNQIQNQKVSEISTFVPSSIFSEIISLLNCGLSPVSTAKLDLLVLYALRKMSKTEISRLPDVCEGLESRIKRCADQAYDLENYYTLLKTKRYVLSRLKRISMSALIGLNETVCKKDPPYIRVVGFNQKGQEVLKIADPVSHVPIITKGAHINNLGKDALQFLEIEKTATSVFSLLLSDPAYKKATRELTTMPMIIK